MERCCHSEKPTPFASPEIRVGVDLVSVAEVRRSVDTFGDRFLRRVFTEAEARYAFAESDHESGRESGGAAFERLAARFAAKEAVKKALALDEEGVGFPEIEVTRAPSGAPSIALHGEALAVARARGVASIALSMSHEAEYATAVVAIIVPRLAETSSRGARGRLSKPRRPSRTFSRTSRYGGFSR